MNSFFRTISINKKTKQKTKQRKKKRNNKQIKKLE